MEYSNKQKLQEIIYNLKKEKPLRSWRNIGRLMGISYHTIIKYYKIYLKETNKECVIIKYKQDIEKKEEEFYKNYPSLKNINLDKKHFINNKTYSINDKLYIGKEGCIKCGVLSNHLEMHHIYPRRYSGKVMVNLCKMCHLYIVTNKDKDLNARLFNSYVGTGKSYIMDMYYFGKIIGEINEQIKNKDRENFIRNLQKIKDKYFYLLYNYESNFNCDMIEDLRERYLTYQLTH